MEDTSDSDVSEGETQELVRQQNRKKKKSGGFQSMGLPAPVFKAVMKKGYKVPSPIQRKSIPLILEGKDVVAMARTGSGKTAAFLIPMFVKLKTHMGQSGARGLILSPTRELALQTLKFTKELGKFTGLKAAVVLGGDNMSEQFSALHSNPDIIIATPGRFMHVVVEMDLKLSSIEYVVFDEADRLFEMGFGTQLREIIHRLSDKRQTCLFSATLPKLLVDFARAGLHDPTLIRLDVDNKISPNLQMSFFQCRPADKDSLLVHVLTNVIKPNRQTVVFLATKHHVEYVNMLLTQSGISCCCVYSSLDPAARKINVAKFENRRCSVLLVTDLAARGIDIPILDSVINYHFPAKCKLFVHRVGRVARAGKSGIAYSFVAPDEMPFLIDLHMFLSRSLKFVPTDKKSDTYEDCLIGQVPQMVLDNYDSEIKLLRTTSNDLTSLDRTCGNAFKLYIKSRPAASKESIQRYKELNCVNIGYHPLLCIGDTQEEARANMLASMKHFRPKSTIFEMAGARSESSLMMQQKRAKHTKAILAAGDERKELRDKFSDDQIRSFSETPAITEENSEGLSLFKESKPKSTSVRSTKHPHHEESVRDEDYYIAYRPSDHQSELGLSVSAGFDQQARAAVLDLTADDNDQMSKDKRLLKWDRKKKKFVGDAGNQGKMKKIKTESGQWISASYKSDVYKRWLRDHNVGEADDQNSEEEETAKPAKTKGRSDQDRLEILGHNRFRHSTNSKDPKQKLLGKRFKNELRSKDQIIKSREIKEHKEWLNQSRTMKKKRGGSGATRGRGGSSFRGKGGSFSSRGGGSSRGRGGLFSSRGGGSSRGRGGSFSSRSGGSSRGRGGGSSRGRGGNRGRR